MDLSYELQNDDFAPMAARRAVERDLGEQLAERMLATVTTVVNELVTNSVRNGPGGSPICLRLQLEHDGRVRGEVDDDGHGVQAIREGKPTGPVPGMPLVDALVDSWGVEDGSTHVWFEIAPPG
jgi:two-component sensor histidine kinase